MSCIAGYNALQAIKGDEALMLVRTAPGQYIDLLLFDILMPGMGGIKVTKQISEVSPATKVLLTTGYSQNLLDVHQHHSTTEFLPKSFYLAALAHTVSRILDEPHVCQKQPRLRTLHPVTP